MSTSNFKILKRSVLLARKFWVPIGISFILSLLATPLALLKPVVLKILIDSGFGSAPVPGFIRFFFPAEHNFTFGSIVILCVILVIIIALIENLYSVATWVLNTFIGEKIVLNFRTLLFNHVQRLSLSYHDQKGTSYSMYRIQWDTMGIRTLLLGNISPLIASFLTLIGMVTVMFIINWRFAVISLCVIPLLYLLTKMSSKRLRKDWDQVKNDESSAVSVITEVLSSVRIVKAFGQEINESQRFENKANKAVKGQMKIAWVAASFSALVGLLFACGTALFIYYGAHFVKSGEMTVGELTLVLAYLTQIYAPLQNISKIANDIQSSFSSLDRVYNLLDKEKEVVENPHSIHISRAKGSFRFDDVSFGYNPSNLTLHNVSFEVKAGDRVGIIGTTGAGKSTLVSLLTRFYDPVSGRIFIDDNEIKNYKLADYRNQFGIVLQEPVLFSTTIGENISYGKQSATEKEIIEAAKAANAHEFICKLKDGYNTVVGERGVTLSGGERQRISIARAFIKNAPVLILDEPTSSVDIRTEALIMDAMERLMEGRTTFMITHRLDTLKSCNVIVHLEAGRLKDIVQNDGSAALEEKKKSMLDLLQNS
jgi:ATP-binding cassette, subfamily B, bacterial